VEQINKKSWLQQTAQSSTGAAAKGPVNRDALTGLKLACFVEMQLHGCANKKVKKKCFSLSFDDDGL